MLSSQNILESSLYRGSGRAMPVRSEHPGLEILYFLDPSPALTPEYKRTPSQLRLRHQLTTIEPERVFAYNGRELHESIDPSHTRFVQVLTRKKLLFKIGIYAGQKARC